MLAIILSFLVYSAMEKSDKNEIAIIAMNNFELDECLYRGKIHASRFVLIELRLAESFVVSFLTLCQNAWGETI